MKQPKSLQPSIYKACSDLYICKLSKMGLYFKMRKMSNIFFLPHYVKTDSLAVQPRQAGTVYPG